jgi:putative hemolysin
MAEASAHHSNTEPQSGSGVDPVASNPNQSRSELQRVYQVRLASDEAEVRTAQKLRFEVFNLELREGLQSSFATGLDVDPFDAFCDHLLVEDLRIQSIVGTYRLQTGPQAAKHLGYYSAQEFDMSPYESRRRLMVELGRACVHKDHRNLVVVGMLWKGISDYVNAHAGRYLIGCSSLTSQDPRMGAAAYLDLQKRHLADPDFRTSPLPVCACPLDQPLERSPKMPKLLAAYLSLGAKIAGPPAIDREFKTIDFLTLMDLHAASPQVVRRYLS